MNKKILPLLLLSAIVIPISFNASADSVGVVFCVKANDEDKNAAKGDDPCVKKSTWSR